LGSVICILGLKVVPVGHLKEACNFSASQESGDVNIVCAPNKLEQDAAGLGHCVAVEPGLVAQHLYD
jgi:hypothetical protein